MDCDSAIAAAPYLDGLGRPKGSGRAAEDRQQTAEIVDQVVDSQPWEQPVHGVDERVDDLVGDRIDHGGQRSRNRRGGRRRTGSRRRRHDRRASVGGGRCRRLRRRRSAWDRTGRVGAAGGEAGRRRRRRSARRSPDPHGLASGSRPSSWRCEPERGTSSVGRSGPARPPITRAADARGAAAPTVGASSRDPTTGICASAADGPMVRRSLPTETATNARTTSWSNWVPAQRTSSVRAASAGSGGLVGACRGHHIEGIGHRDDPRGQADLVATEPGGVAIAVPSLVVLPDAAHPVAEPGLEGSGEPSADRRMLLDLLPLAAVRRPRLLSTLLGTPTLPTS